MEIRRPEDAGAFLRLARPLLERDEARNQLPLAIAATIAVHRDAYDAVRYWVALDNDRPVAAALRTEPFNLVLADPEPGADLEPLLTAVLADDPGVPGIVGNAPDVDAASSFRRRLPSRRALRATTPPRFPPPAAR